MKNIIKMFIAVLFFLFFQYAVSIGLIGFLGTTYVEAHEYYVITLLNFINDLGVCIFMIIMLWKVIKKGFNSWKDKIKRHKFISLLWDIWVGFCALLVFKYVISILCSLISLALGVTEETVANQQIIEELLGSATVMMTIATCIFAPIAEELVFRGAFKEAIKNKKVFITVSGLIFGFMHVTQNLFLLLGIMAFGLFVDYAIEHKEKFKKFCVTEKTLYIGVIILFIILLIGNNSQILLSVDKNEIIGSIVYISLGCFLAHIYAKSDNILYSIVVHALNNILSVLMVLL